MIRWVLILGVALVAWAACQQPFYLPQGQKSLCPAGSHVVYVKGGIRCVSDSSPSDSVP